MPEARDRLSRQDGVVSAFSRRRVFRDSGGGDTRRGGSVISVLEDEMQTPVTPFRWRGAAMVGTPRPTGLAADGAVVTPRTGRRSALTVGRENISPAVGSGRGRGRGRGSPLPIWYPRRPLREVTALVRAIERSTERRSGALHQQTEGHIPRDSILRDPSPSTSDARSEPDISLTSPIPTTLKRRCPQTVIGKVPKILLGITQENDGDTAFLTPQKKLLNNIDTAEKVVMEELRKLKRSPLARREERRKRIRTLMSMR